MAPTLLARDGLCVFSQSLRDNGRARRMAETKVKGGGGDKMWPSSLCNYLPIFSPSVAFIIPLRSHPGVGDCHSVAAPSLSARRMKCRSPPTDLCLPDRRPPLPWSPLALYLFPGNGRRLEIRIIINQRIWPAIYAAAGVQGADGCWFLTPAWDAADRLSPTYVGGNTALNPAFVLSFFLFSPPLVLDRTELNVKNITGCERREN